VSAWGDLDGTVDWAVSDRGDIVEIGRTDTGWAVVIHPDGLGGQSIRSDMASPTTANCLFGQWAGAPSKRMRWVQAAECAVERLRQMRQHPSWDGTDGVEFDWDRGQ
jgi:hypothetical protein